MDFQRKPRVKITEGWALSDGLVKNPYASRFTDPVGASQLCAEFKRVVFEDGVPVRPSRAHYPDYLALTEAELHDTTYGSRANIMGVRGELRQAAFEKFPPLIKPVPAPSHVIEPVEDPQLLVVYRQPRQMAAAITEDHHFQMRG
jgi:hypothetical protein